MNRDLDWLAGETHDVLIVGGGIVGAGAARDAALRGLRVALIDQGDFASGTSSRSSKLVHGGLRYLEHAEFRLVHEACRERQILMTIAPHLVRPLPLLFPCYRGTSRSLWKVRCGLALYDWLAGARVIERHRILSPDEVRRVEPDLEQKNLEGAGLYFDCRMNDSRLCLENILSAAVAGAVTANYVRLLELSKTNGRTCGARAVDLESGREFDIRARVVLNATGPWADDLRRMDDPGVESLVRKTRGIHILTRPLIRSGGLAATARTNHRLIFILPFDKTHSLIGTTDTDSQEDPGQPRVDSEDVQYLLSEINLLLPSARLGPGDVRGMFAGLRTLISTPGKPSDLSREYRIEESRSGLISVIGGKYTTYRVMAARVIDRIERRLGRPKTACTTDSPLPSATVRLPELSAEAIPPPDGIRAEVAYTIQSEMARRPMDFLRRRTPLCLTHAPDPEALRHICDVFQKHLDWDARRTENEYALALTEWTQHHLF